MTSISLLKDGLDTFSAWSRLQPNNNKSQIFIVGGSNELRSEIILAFGFTKGKLLVRYLGVPIISSRLGKADCVSLIDRITARVQSWTQRFLSFAGRLQLIKSVLHAIQAYLDRIKQIPRQYLCKGSRLGKGRAKVSWEDVCLPKNEGGLGICRLRDCNKAVMLKHVWILFTNKESLWYKWTHSTFLKRKSFWVVKEPTFCSWAWKRILYLRIEFRLSFRWRVGDGQSVSFWFDHWHLRGPLDLIFSDSMIYSCSLSMQAMVVDLFHYREVLEDNVRFLELPYSYPLPERTEYEAEKMLYLLKDYDLSINYHCGKANVVADALSRKSSGNMVALLTSQKPILEDMRKLDLEVLVHQLDARLANL
ncbi:uncharacterized protein LOC120287528 [Eucalyptus grandis]|uniref:uncharacterized protein LOC120287528 n=1 Tax=Eucalyptus grandis TaxID=71139 RepID=UPI00192E8ED2|nr:uncharacterized protein LOC120287528 [Eucalyptus grandis]